MATKLFKVTEYGRETIAKSIPEAGQLLTNNGWLVELHCQDEKAITLSIPNEKSASGLLGWANEFENVVNMPGTENVCFSIPCPPEFTSLFIAPIVADYEKWRAIQNWVPVGPLQKEGFDGIMDFKDGF